MQRAQRSPVLRRLEGLSHPRIVALCLTLVVGVGVADHLSGDDIAFTAIYLLPISLAAWMLRPRDVALLTFASAAVWLGVDVWDHALPRHPMVEVVNLGLELGIFLVFGLLLTSLRRSLDGERALARTDALTGIHNRRAFWDAAEAELERCRRFGQAFSVAYLDVDGFKAVNDRRGHRAGDELLQAIATTLQNGVRRVDLAARIGGDEFALLLPGTGADGARVVLDKLRERLACGLQATYGVSCSIGCITVQQAPRDLDELIARTDALMYQAKRDHRGQLRHEVLAVGDQAPAGRRRQQSSDAG